MEEELPLLLYLYRWIRWNFETFNLVVIFDYTIIILGGIFMRKTLLKTFTTLFLLAAVLIPPLAPTPPLPPTPPEEGDILPTESEEPGIEPHTGRGTEEDT